MVIIQCFLLFAILVRTKTNLNEDIALMNKVLSLLILILIFSCEKDYEIIDTREFEKLVVQEVLVEKSNYSVMKVGKSVQDEFPKLLVKNKRIYLFENDCELFNDSIIHSYYPAFIIDKDGEFRKNGIWIHAEFYNEGTFPFHSKNIKYSVDSIPEYWDGNLPVEEGIYFFENNKLKQLSQEQSEEEFKKGEKNGFYFIPNKGRLFDKIFISDL